MPHVHFLVLAEMIRHQPPALFVVAAVLGLPFSSVTAAARVTRFLGFCPLALASGILAFAFRLAFTALAAFALAAPFTFALAALVLIGVAHLACGLFFFLGHQISPIIGNAASTR